MGNALLIYRPLTHKFQSSAFQNVSQKINTTTTHAREILTAQQKRRFSDIPDDCIGDVFKFLSLYTLFRVLCVSSIFNKNAHKTLSKIAELPDGILFFWSDHLQKVRSLKQHCRGLRVLTVGIDVGADFQGNIVDLAVSLPLLRHIKLCWFYPTDKFLTNISLMLPKLESLILSVYGDVSLNLVQCENLESLRITFVTISEEHLALFLNQTPTLKVLSLEYVRGLHFTNMFTGVGMLPNLRDIHIYPHDEMEIDFRTAQTIVAVMLNLETVYLSKCSFGVRGLLELLKLDKLHELSICDADLDDFPSGVVKLSMYVFCAKRCFLYDGCIGRIARAFPNLQKLDLKGNPQVTQNGLEQLDALNLTL